jgi:hypothetical protein
MISSDVVVEFRCSRTLIRGDRLRMLERAAIQKIRCNSRRPKGVTAGGIGQASPFRLSFDHIKHALRVIGLLVSLLPFLKLRNSGRFFSSSIPSGGNSYAKILIKIMMSSAPRGVCRLFHGTISRTDELAENNPPPRLSPYTCPRARIAHGAEQISAIASSSQRFDFKSDLSSDPVCGHQS